MVEQHALDEEAVKYSTIRLRADQLVEEKLKCSSKDASMVE